jgi:hypothetical protein
VITTAAGVLSSVPSATRSRASSAARPLNPAIPGGSAGSTRTCAAARLSPVTTRSACRHCATYPGSPCSAATNAVTRSAFIRRRPGRKQSTTVVLPASSVDGRPARVQAALTRSLSTS